jgi:hypothetical protein
MPKVSTTPKSENVNPIQTRSAVRPIVLAIDVEPDGRKTDRSREAWEGTRRGLRHLEEFRLRMEAGTRRLVQLNWFLRTDPQIRITWGAADYVASACPELLKWITPSGAKSNAQGGDSAGIHPHMWRWDETRRAWFNDFRDPDWLAECFETSVEGFQRIFGRPPEACRFGDRWLNQAAVDMMAARGIRYDLTIEPGLASERPQDDPLATCPLPDYRRAPRKPYQPDPSDFLKADGGLTPLSPCTPLWMIPLTTSQPYWALGGKWPFVQKLSRSPNLVTPPALLWPWMAAHLNREGSDALVIALRSGDLANPEHLANFVETMGRLERHPEVSRCEFTTPAAVIERLKGLSEDRAAVATA